METFCGNIFILQCILDSRIDVGQEINIGLGKSSRKNKRRALNNRGAWKIWQKFEVHYLVQLIEHPILRIPNFNFPNLRCCKVFFSF
jgi:hypothetical protein